MYLKRSAIKYSLWLRPDLPQCKFHGGTSWHRVDRNGTMGHHFMLLLIGPKNEGLGQDIQSSIALKLPCLAGCHKHHCYIPGKGWLKVWKLPHKKDLENSGRFATKNDELICWQMFFFCDVSNFEVAVLCQTGEVSKYFPARIAILEVLTGKL